MSNKEIKMNRMWQYKDGSKIEFNYSGIINNPFFSEEKLTSILTNIFASAQIAPSLVETTIILKNIFRELQEQSLEIYVDKEKEYYEGAMYHQTKLSRYSYHKLAIKEEQADIEMDYICTPKKGIQTNFSTKDHFETKYNITQYQNIFNECMKTIQQLQNIKPTKLNDYDKIICTIYRLFYQENPDFSKPEHRTRTQTMLAFLIEYDICVPRNRNDFYSFNLRNNSNIVSSIDLITNLNRLAFLGEITEEMGHIELSDWSKQTIETVGQEIRKHMNNQENPTAWFINLVRINYIKKYCLSSRSNLQDIAEYSNCPKDTVTNTLKLVKKIDKKVKDPQN